MYKIISGMSINYYNTIGKHMLSSWLKYWPKEFSITVYSEDKLPIRNSRIKVIDLNTMGEEYEKIQQEKMKLANRIKTFAKKAWPIMKNLEKDSGKLIWIDADVITDDDITIDWLDSLIESDDFSCHIGVPQGQYYSVETGFFIINLENKFKNEFLNEYRRIYYTRDFSNLHKPYDGDIFGKVIRHLKCKNDFKYSELNVNYETSLSPFNSIFENKMKHFKAKRKNIFKEDQI